ncbi:carboxymuconolactone decarboxylase family protein [Polyangium jinanense]|uniref:Carboxymuconolactone decarboxylase family protein n=1 Tax=Polyangium jinanense TaxID=2829994 RepID=A0A9X3X644_9BACT|nr:carboxymuconolactone decarboxylase family protein [Polyangium jinanense]MDC3955530.1 carboxymuconolactone decarboxylase family protein [Polyangium jinanense]MDC3982166.1 carboxymuconolactone decarboxylase family protein [Polyangium jinanense]
MKQRIAYQDVAPKAFRALLALAQHVRTSGLDHKLVELVNLRVSQMNGCAFCIDMHTKELRAAGETEQRLYLLSAYREAPFYSDRERAALAWAEAVTELGKDGVSDAVYEEARRHFGEAELVELTVAVIHINAWNRMNVPFRMPAGTYTPSAR